MKFFLTGTARGGFDALPPSALAELTWPAFLFSLVPVTIGNIIGGSVLVGAVYWFVYLRHRDAG